jgi:hypothetical protein
MGGVQRHVSSLRPCVWSRPNVQRQVTIHDSASTRYLDMGELVYEQRDHD